VPKLLALACDLESTDGIVEIKRFWQWIEGSRDSGSWKSIQLLPFQKPRINIIDSGWYSSQGTAPDAQPLSIRTPFSFIPPSSG
jgi:hypothetical protein